MITKQAHISRLRTTLWVGLVFGAAVAVLGTSPPVLAQSDLCDFTPRDGYWGSDLFGANNFLFGVGTMETSVQGALDGCVNTVPLDDGSLISVAVFSFDSSEGATAAMDELRTEAGTATTVSPFTGQQLDALGEGAWFANFAYETLAFTQTGQYLVGGHSEESYERNRDEYLRVLVERMAQTVSNLGGPEEDLAEESGDDGSTGIITVIGGAAAVGAAATAVRTARRRPKGGTDQEQKEDQEDEEELAIVQVSTDRVEVDFENPATLEVQAWLSTPSRGVVQAPDIPLQIAMPPTLGLTVFPTSGSGRLDVDITVDETAEDGEVTITVSGSYKGRETRQPVTVVIGGGYRLEVY